MLLCIGISIGIMSSFVANQTKVNKVEANSKQTENLVNDLEDELKTKDSSTVNDDLHNGEKQCDKKTAEKSESISKIEAELKAELERLEINMKSSNIETRLSDVFEVSSIQILMLFAFTCDVKIRQNYVINCLKQIFDHKSSPLYSFIEVDSVVVFRFCSWSRILK